MPVTLPPGRLRLSTRPNATGLSGQDGYVNLAGNGRQRRPGGQEGEHLSALQHGLGPHQRQLRQQFRALPVGAEPIEFRAFAFALAVTKNPDNILNVL
jgi:hypothetical protein